MKTTLSAIIAIISLGFSAFAADSAYRFEYTIVYKDGSKSLGSTSFLPQDGIAIPLHMDSLGICVLTYSRDLSGVYANDKENIYGRFSIRDTQGDKDAAGRELFSTCLPVMPGKEIELLKANDLSVSVKIIPAEQQK